MEVLFKNNKENSLIGKWIHLENVEPLLDSNKDKYKIEVIGKSFLSKPIYSITIGKGNTKILMWTQMHGNEATATKVVFDLLNLFNNKSTPNNITEILNACTIKIIPLLNPDGALAYTRVNAQQIDLNRDAVSLKAPESKLLRTVLTCFKPDFCFNLHDQRNIYSVAKTTNPASKKLTPARVKAMSVIYTMFKAIKNDLPNCVSRYNDEFYPNATGDNFQKDGYCTILIEAGHIQDDYDREKVRYYYFKALLTGLLSIANKSFINKNVYDTIPQNETYYLDIIYNNVYFKNKNISIGILYIEEINQGKIKRIPTIKRFGNLSKYGANKIIDTKGVKINSINEFLSKI